MSSDHITVRVGQVWADNDPRTATYRIAEWEPGTEQRRLLRVLVVGEFAAKVESLVGGSNSWRRVASDDGEAAGDDPASSLPSDAHGVPAADRRPGGEVVTDREAPAPQISDETLRRVGELIGAGIEMHYRPHQCDAALDGACADCRSFGGKIAPIVAAAALASCEAEVRRWRETYELKLADFARETLRTSAALEACKRSAVPQLVVGEALLGYWDAQEAIRRAIERAAP